VLFSTRATNCVSGSAFADGREELFGAGARGFGQAALKDVAQKRDQQREIARGLQIRLAAQHAALSPVLAVHAVDLVNVTE